MPLGGRRVKVSRPRARSVDDEQGLPVQTYEFFTGEIRSRLDRWHA